MKRVPKELINEMFEKLFINDNHDITDFSAREAFNWVKQQDPKYNKTLFVGLFKEIKAYQRRVKLEKKKNKLLGL